MTAVNKSFQKNSHCVHTCFWLYVSVGLSVSQFSALMNKITFNGCRNCCYGDIGASLAAWFGLKEQEWHKHAKKLPFIWI